jgi:hypothetical protein
MFSAVEIKFLKKSTVTASFFRQNRLNSTEKIFSPFRTNPDFKGLIF